MSQRRWGCHWGRSLWRYQSCLGRCDSWRLGTLYWITSALDRYVMLSGRTPHTRMMMSQYMQQRLLRPAVYSLKKYYLHVQFCFRPVCFHLVCFCPVCSVWFASVQAELPADKAGHQLIPTLLGYIYEHCEFGPTVDLSLWKKMQIKVAVKVDKRDVKETRCHSETIEVPLEENRYLRSLIWLENVSSLLVLYAWI